MKNNIEKIQNLAFIGMIFIMLFFGMQFLTQAQDAATSGEPENECNKYMTDVVTERSQEFGDFINTHFRSEKPTSELIPVAIERYRQFRDEIRAELGRFSTPVKTPGKEKEAMAVTGIQPACEAMVLEKVKAAKEILKTHIITNARAKKSTRLIDKYKQINDRLNRLNFTVAQMYGYFATLSQKLPCYPAKGSCVPQ